MASYARKSHQIINKPKIFQIQEGDRAPVAPPHVYYYLNLIFYFKQWPFNLKQEIKGNKHNSMNSVILEIHPFYGKTKFGEKDN